MNPLRIWTRNTQINYKWTKLDCSWAFLCHVKWQKTKLQVHVIVGSKCLKSNNSTNQLSGIKPTIKCLKYARSEKIPPRETSGKKSCTLGPEYQELNNNYKGKNDELKIKNK